MSAPLRVEISRLKHEAAMYREHVSRLEQALTECYTTQKDPAMWGTRTDLLQRLCFINDTVTTILPEAIEGDY